MSSWKECTEPYLLSKAHAERDRSSVAEHLESCERCFEFWQEMDEMRAIACQIPVLAPSALRVREVRRALLAESRPPTAIRARAVAWALGAAAITTLIGQQMMTERGHRQAVQEPSGAGPILQTATVPEAHAQTPFAGGGAPSPGTPGRGVAEAAGRADRQLAETAGSGALTTAAAPIVAPVKPRSAAPSQVTAAGESTLAEAPRTWPPSAFAPPTREQTEQRSGESASAHEASLVAPHGEESRGHVPMGVGQQVSALTERGTVEPRTQSKAIVAPWHDEPKPGRTEQKEQHVDQRSERQERRSERQDERAERQRERRLEQQERREERRGK